MKYDLSELILTSDEAYHMVMNGEWSIDRFNTWFAFQRDMSYDAGYDNGYNAGNADGWMMASSTD